MCHLRGQSARFTAIVFSSFLIGVFNASQPSSAQCTDPVPSTPIEGLVAAQPVLDWGWCVAMHESGDFTIVWIDDSPPGKLGVVRAQRYCRSGSLLGVSAALTDAGGTRSSLSVASSRLGHYCVTWTSAPGDAAPSILTTHLQEFDFDDFTFTGSTPSADYGDFFPSAGASDATTNRVTVSWSNAHENEGLHYAIDGAQAGTLRTCDTVCPARANFWSPCVSTRSEDGITAIAYAFDEIPGLLDSPLNIALVIIDESGVVLERRDGPDIDDPTQWVNNPMREDPTAAPEDNTFQYSPSVAFVGDDIVVAWVGPGLASCDGPINGWHVYARRFKYDDSADPGLRLRDPDPTLGEGRAGMFIVDTDPAWMPDNHIFGRPTVALSLSPDQYKGRFIVAWNATAGSVDEVHAQYFDVQGQPRGREFRVHVADGPTYNNERIRHMSLSSSHTIAYGADDQVVAVWRTKVPTEAESAIAEIRPFYTLLPPNYALTTIPACGDCEMNPELCDPCLKGDADNDCLVNLYDIAPFVDALLYGDFTCADILEVCRVDMNNDARINGLDIQCFVDTLVGRSCTLPTLRFDCNLNGIPDDEDITAQTSSDVNTNGMPDECEPDCNSNGVPDEWDIAQATSYDCDTDGIPDECGEDCNENGIADVCDLDPADPDGNSLVSADCNTNGYPDECEPDCNTNGVPDDCDMDPTDPDGDEWVSPDCNGNDYPDECDLALPPPFGSSDCNTNGIPDECDIAECESDPACDDCNENGIPDACDIAAQISEDVNTNGIPDECEGESLMGGGGGESMAASSESGESEGSEEAAWEAFYDWAIQQCWGPDCPDSGVVQFQRMVDKMRELGLPVGAPDR